MDDLMGTLPKWKSGVWLWSIPKKAWKVRAFEKGLEKRLKVLDENINANMTDVNLESTAKEHEHLKNEHLFGRGRRETNKIQYFLNMETTNFNKNVITELKVPEGPNIVDEEKLSEEIKLFYKNLFTSTNHITDETFQKFTKKTPIKIQKLSDEENNQIEGKLINFRRIAEINGEWKITRWAGMTSQLSSINVALIS